MPTKTDAQSLILIADDDPTSRLALRQALVAQGYGVAEVGDGLAALEQYARLRPSVVLLDVQMPGLDGFEVCERLRAARQSVPVIMITALDERDAIDRAYQAGATDYVTKPVDWDVLNHRLGVLVQAQQSRKQLEEERDLLRTLIDNLPDYIFIKDAQGRFVASNVAHARAAQTAAVDDLIGKTAFDFWPEELAAQYQADDQNVIDSGLPLINAERTTVDALGNQRVVLTNKIPLRNKDGKPTWLIGISRDITQRKQTEEALRSHAVELEDRVAERTKALQEALKEQKELNVLKASFVSMVSHEVRTPLTTIASSTGLLQIAQEKMVPEQRQKHFEKIHEAVKRIVELLEDVLDYSGAEADYVKFNPERLNLERLCAEVVKEVQGSLAQSHTVIFSTRGAFGDVFVDRELMRQIVTNLLTNAVKYSPQGGNVYLDLAHVDDCIEIRVRDSGIGIPAEDQKRVFEPFHRGLNVGVVPGTGLGLAIVKRAVDLHGGTVCFESELGQGTTFVVTLPDTA